VREFPNNGPPCRFPFVLELESKSKNPIRGTEIGAHIVMNSQNFVSEPLNEDVFLDTPEARQQHNEFVNYYVASLPQHQGIPQVPLMPQPVYSRDIQHNSTQIVVPTQGGMPLVNQRAHERNWASRPKRVANRVSKNDHAIAMSVLDTQAKEAGNRDAFREIRAEQAESLSSSKSAAPQRFEKENPKKPIDPRLIKLKKKIKDQLETFTFDMGTEIFDTDYYKDSSWFCTRVVLFILPILFMSLFFSLHITKTESYDTHLATGQQLAQPKLHFAWNYYNVMRFVYWILYWCFTGWTLEYTFRWSLRWRTIRFGPVISVYSVWLWRTLVGLMFLLVDRWATHSASLQDFYGNSHDIVGINNLGIGMFSVALMLYILLRGNSLTRCRIVKTQVYRALNNVKAPLCDVRPDSVARSDLIHDDPNLLRVEIVNRYELLHYSSTTGEGCRLEELDLDSYLLDDLLEAAGRPKRGQYISPQDRARMAPPEEVTISMETVAQLLTLSNVTPGCDDKLLFERITFAARNLTTVNMNRYDFLNLNKNDRILPHHAACVMAFVIAKSNLDNLKRMPGFPTGLDGLAAQGIMPSK